MNPFFLSPTMTYTTPTSDICSSYKNVKKLGLFNYKEGKGIEERQFRWTEFNLITLIWLKNILVREATLTQFRGIQKKSQ